MLHEGSRASIEEFSKISNLMTNTTAWSSQLKSLSSSYGQLHPDGAIGLHLVFLAPFHVPIFFLITNNVDRQ